MTDASTVQDRNTFVDEPKKKDVAQPRQTATSTTPNQTAAPTPSPTRSYTKNQLNVEVSVVPPPFTLDVERAGVQQAASDMYDLVFQKSKLGPQLLDEIAALPAGVLDPPEGKLPADARKQLPKVTQIKVSLIPPDPNDSEKGDYKPQGYGPTYTGYSSSYLLEVRAEARDKPASIKDRYTYWPGFNGLPKEDYIIYGHYKAGSVMATYLYHELLHVWFVYKYWFFTGQTGNSLGHGDYTVRAHGFPFYDPGELVKGKPTYPFREKLRAFFAEIDSLEGVKTPVQVSPNIPWAPP